MPNSADSTLQMAFLQRAADVLKTVAHPVRLQIIDMLERGEATVSELCRSLDLPQPYASQQLNLMKARGVLESRREGNQVYYAISNPGVIKVIHCVRQQAEAADGSGGRVETLDELKQCAKPEQEG